MKRSRTLVGLTGAALLAAAGSVVAAPPSHSQGRPAPKIVGVQMLSFNDFHGHLEATDNPLSVQLDPDRNAVGGVEYLAATINRLRATAPDGRTVTVAAGDLIGGSTFLSGLFHDEPSVESMNALGLDVSSVGNHEFDEGTTELLRMQNGGCHPVDGCYFPTQPYAGADFQWLAANVQNRNGRGTLLPGTTIKNIRGVRIGFIGMTLEETPTLVNPQGVASVVFLDEADTANREAKKLEKRGVDTIVVLLHEGGQQAGTYNSCDGPSGPIVDIVSRMDPSIDALVTGHTHQPYVCWLPNKAGQPRLVTSAASFGQVVTETTLAVDRRTGDVVQAETTATNHLVTRDQTADPAETAVIAKWKAISDPIAGRVVGTVAQDVTGDASGNRGVETPMGDLIADSILWGTSAPDAGGAQIAFMNIGGVRASFTRDAITNGEAVGEITYAEAYATSPFGNLLVTIDMTGDQIRRVLEQQYDPTRGRQNLALAVSEGFTYTWDATQPQGLRVVPGSMALNGVPIDPAATYRVATLNFLAAGGDAFTVFTEGTNLLGGSEDIANLVAYLQAHPGVTPPADRVSGL